MKRAIGELNLTVVTLVAIAAILGLFMGFKGTMFKSVMSPICCVMSKGKMNGGTCDVGDNASYYDCMGQVERNTSKSSSSVGNEAFLNSSNSISNSSIFNNSKDNGVAKSVNKSLSVSSNSDKKKDDNANSSLDKKSKSSINSTLSKTKGSNNGKSSGVYKGSPDEIRRQLSNGFNTKGDYSKSKVTSTTSSYSADGKTYTTTSIVTSNTSNNKLRITTTYTKNSSGNYEISSVEWAETSKSSIEKNGYEETIGQQNIKNSYNSIVKNQYNTEKLDNYIKDNAENIYNELNGNVVILNTYSGESIVSSANGFFINKGVIVTTWNYIKDSVINGNKIVITNSSSGTYTFDGVISINTELDLAFIKLKEEIGQKPVLGNVYDLKLESIDFTLCSDEDYNLQIKYGYLLKRGGLITSLITLEAKEEGSPLYDSNKNVIGINTAKVLNSSTSIARSTNYIKNFKKKLDDYEFSKLETTSFETLKEKYSNKESEVNDNQIPKKVWNKYKSIGDIENTITSDLVKSSYDKNIVSLRYKNDIKKYSDNFALADNFISKLKKQGYKEKLSSTYKLMYEKGSSKVVLLNEFDYLIIIIMGG